MRNRCGQKGRKRLKRRRRDEGQVIVITALVMVVLLAMTGLVIDVGRLYLAQRDLQKATDAAALAGAQDIPDGITAVTTACSYSAADAATGSCDGAPAGVNGKNSVNSVSDVQMTSQLECLSVAAAGIKLRRR